MTDRSNISKDGFETLLRWLDPEREAAGHKYEEIREGLVKMFLARGCTLADELADETMDRVIKRCNDIYETYEGNPILYFYGVARKVLLESRRRPIHQELPSVLIAAAPEDGSEDIDAKYECLKECLGNLVSTQRELIVGYYDYTGTKRDKIDRRNEIRQKLGVTSEVLRTRIFRIRASLQNCIRDCVEKKAFETFR